MKKRRIIWGILLIVLLLNAMLSDSIPCLYLFLGAFLVPLFSIVLTGLLIKEMEIEIILPDTAQKSQPVEGILKATVKGHMPVFCGTIETATCNCLTGKTEKTMLNAGFTKKEKAFPFIVFSPHCGMIEAIAERIHIYDPFGLWKKTINLDVNKAITILPDTFDLHLKLAQGNVSNQESIEYAQERPGNDLSEIFAIREYQEGDSIRNIHWKLSSKYDDLMIRLASLPLEKSMLLLLETDLKEQSDMQPDAFDAMAEIYITLSQTLVDNEIGHKAGWYDHLSQKMFLFEIHDEEDLHSIIGKNLAAGREITGNNAIQRYLDEIGEFDQAHMVYVTHQDEAYLEKLPEDMIKTVIVCSEKNAAATGPYDYTCTPENYQIQLQTMII